MFSQSLVLALGLPLGVAAETVLGVYMFSRHGDRTAKQPGNTVLTDLGYQEIYTSGNYYRNRYIASNATNQIFGISADTVKQSQIAASSPYDNVLMPSAQGFLQGLYPPVGEQLGSNTLRNKTVVQTPLGGYQLLPIQTIQTGQASENSAWLQGQTGCANAATSSNDYLSSTEYNALLKSTNSFYQNFTDLTNSSFTNQTMTFKNAYAIFDLFNVAEIHNATFDPQGVLNADNMFQLRTLADTHEWNLAYNASDPIRAISGATLAAQVVQGLNSTITGKGASKFQIQFGAYASFQSLFGLANLTAANPDFYGVPDYASSMVFELVTNASTSSGFPATSDISVRFLFHNGTTSNISTPSAYPLFGQQNEVLSWNDFATGMNKFAIGDQASWCKACGNSTGVCASATSSSTSGSASASANQDSSSGSGLSNAVAGVIGAMVTLAVILGLELLIMLIAGLRLVSKKRLNRGVPQVVENGGNAKA